MAGSLLRGAAAEVARTLSNAALLWAAQCPVPAPCPGCPQCPACPGAPPNPAQPGPSGNWQQGAAGGCIATLLVVFLCLRCGTRGARGVGSEDAAPSRRAMGLRALQPSGPSRVASALPDWPGGVFGEWARSYRHMGRRHSRRRHLRGGFGRHVGRRPGGEVRRRRPGGVPWGSCYRFAATPGAGQRQGWRAAAEEVALEVRQVAAARAGVVLRGGGRSLAPIDDEAPDVVGEPPEGHRPDRGTTADSEPRREVDGNLWVSMESRRRAPRRGRRRGFAGRGSWRPRVG